MWNDVRYGLRTLARSPGFTAVAVIALALGIGANTAVFTVVNSVLLRPLPFPEPERLYALAAMPENPFVSGPMMADGQYVEFRKQDRLFEKLAAFHSSRVNMTGAGDAQSVQAAFVTADFFSVLRARPAMGRTFLPEEDHTGRDGVVVLSNKLWRADFAGDPGAIGKSVKLDGVSHTIIGIMPAGFAFPSALDLWVPQAVRLDEHNSLAMPVIGRLRPSVTPAEAVAELDTVIKQMPRDPRDEERSTTPPTRVISLLEYVSGKAQRSLVIFLGAVAFVLLIGCANVANLMLARAAGRRQEMAVRAAMGASRGRLMRQLLTESTLVALAGGAAGLLLALWGVPALLAIAPEGRLPRVEQIRIDGWVFAFTLTVSLVTGLAFGILPALQATRRGLRESLNLGGRTMTGRHETVRSALVISEIALALVLLTGAGLMLKSFLLLRSGETGFRAENVITMTVELPDTVYQTPPQINAFREQTLAKLSRLPGVTAASAINWLPFGGFWTAGDFHLEDGRPFPPNYMVDKPCVIPGYFQAMGIRVVSGRDFSARDNAEAPGVVIVSQSVARRFWPGQNPIGKRINGEDPAQPKDWLKIVGVVEDVKQMGMADQRGGAIYQPLTQVTRTGWASHIAFVVRTTSNPEALASTMRAVVRDVDKDQPVQTVATMTALIAATTAEQQFQTRLLGAFSMLALLLAAVGIYGVLAYSVAQRTHEIGIRMALGAHARDVLRMVLRRTLVLAGLGVAVGAVVALGVTRVLAKFLFEVKPSDPATFLAVAVLLSGVALGAGWIPARRATKVDPMEALRYE
jgi:putative ABC transport system permease protein